MNTSQLILSSLLVTSPMVHTLAVSIPAVAPSSPMLSLPTMEASSGALPNPQQQTKNNIIIINCDDMGYGDLSCFGNPTIKTPHLDQMAIQGQKWSSFYVSSPVSSPSRAGLLTGRMGVRTGMYGDRRGVLFPNSPEGLPATEYTIADILRSAGYHTACVGKWHIGHHKENLPLRHGFDYFYGFPFSNDMSRTEQAKFGNKNYPYQFLVYEQDSIVARDPEQYNLTRQVTQKAIHFIESQQNHPFFLYLAHPMPHFPVYSSAKFQGKSEGGKYGDTIEELDWSVGAILQCLKELHLDKNTLVIFTSDNGPWLPYKTEAGTAGPLRDGKNSHYEGGFRVPCIMWGSMVQPGHVTQMGSTLDLLPTFCEMAGIDLPSDRTYDGVSLVNILSDCSAESKRNTFFFYRGSKLFAVRKGKYKLHFMDKSAYGPDPVRLLETPVLYDLGADPGEHYDIASQHPEVVSDLIKLAEEHKKATPIAESIFDK